MKENNNKNSVELCVLCGEPEAVILANGDYPTHPIPLQILTNAPYIVCCHILHYISDQETNDQTKAVNFLLSQGKKNIAIVGATGKREDHTLGNISLLIDYMRTGAHVRMLTDYGIFIPCHDTCSFPSQPGQQISIINFGAHNLRGEGLVYPLSDFTNWWQGTLNESTETEFSIHAEGEYLVVINY